MATPLPCDNHPGQMAAVLITNLENGETLTLCGPCMFEWAAVLAAVEDQGIAPTETAQEPAEEVANLESATPTPDAQPKSWSELDPYGEAGQSLGGGPHVGPAQTQTPAEEPAPEHRAKTAQETQAAGE